MPHASSETLAVVVVIYNPDDHVVSRLRDIARGVGVVIAVNNGMDECIRDQMTDAGVVVVGGGENVGLSRALNLGLETAWALDTPVTHVLFLDQDSQPAEDMARRLQQAFEKARADGLRPACVVPRLTDIKARSENTQRRTGLIEIDTAATSGTLTSYEVIRDVGGMMDDLFIDCIDHEWCFRAKHLQYTIYQDNGTEMLHDMGELAVNFLGLYKPMYRSPIRHFYIIRNTLLLLGKTYVPARWKTVNLIKTGYRIIAYVMASTDRSASLRLIAQGLVDGVAGRSDSRPASVTRRVER